MKFPWFGGSLVTFWQPIISPGMKWWRDLHVRAHLIGGVVWTTLFRFVVFATPTHTLVDLRFNVALRLAAVGLWQLTAWEAVQRENWRWDNQTPRPESQQYPWLSAIWDTLFTVVGAALFELTLKVLL